jgi:5-oxoprolinase (ATP-hydrolysing)
MKTVYIHRYAGILSAYGLALADVVHDVQTPVHCAYNQGRKFCELILKKLFLTEAFPNLCTQLYRLCDDGHRHLTAMGFDETNIIFELYMHMRYDRTDCALMCTLERVFVGCN